MTAPVRPFALALVLMALSLPASSAEQSSEQARPAQTQDETLKELERKADELSETARRTIEEFVNLVGPMLTRLSRLIEGLPTYETPEVLPNGDIIIRRRHDPVTPDTGTGDDDGLTET